MKVNYGVIHPAILLNAFCGSYCIIIFFWNWKPTFYILEFHCYTSSYASLWLCDLATFTFLSVSANANEK